MKTRQAKRVARSLSNGNLKSPHEIRAAALRLGVPLIYRGEDEDVIFHPAGLVGKFYKYYSRDYSETVVVPESQRMAYERNREYRGGLELGSKPGTILFRPFGGSDIVSSSRRVAKYALSLKARVVISFNDVEVVVRPFFDSNYASREYDRISNERYEAYLNSDEYRQAEAERLAEIQRNQEIINHSMLLLPAVIDAGLNAVVDWLDNITEASDHSGVNVPVDSILNQLTAAGYILGDNASSDPDLQKLNHELIEANPNMFGRYIVGQAMNCLSKMGSIHQVIHKFAHEYRQKVAA